MTKSLRVMMKSFVIMAFMFLLTACTSVYVAPNETNQTSKINEISENNKSNKNNGDKFSSQPISNENNNLVNAHVIRVIDGDTAVVNLDGKEETVRFLLIDSSEMNSNNNNPPEPFAEEAKQYLSQLIEGKTIQLELGENQRDKYNRLLAWLFIDDKSVQEELLIQGLVKVRYIYEPNTKYLDKYKEAEAHAKSKSIGIWSIPGFADSGDDYNLSAVANSSKINENKVSSGECMIKGNINRKGEKIYHTENSPWYQQTKPEKMFCTEEEALNDGFRKAG